MLLNTCSLAVVILLAFPRTITAQPPSPLQQRTINTTDTPVYDTRLWAFNAEAPVRATPLIRNAVVFFGTSKGDFFAINKKTALLKWKFNTGSAIHSSATGINGRIFFSDNKQTLYCLNENDGHLIWKFEMTEKKEYPWRFDYYYSSPVLIENDLVIGGDDGYLYRLSQQNGTLIWKFQAAGLIRSTPAIYKNAVLFGDTEARFYSLDLKSGRKRWEFKIVGDSIDNYKYGYDKRAVTSSAVTTGNKVLFGSRDAFLYCLDIENGNCRWKISHEPSWIISTVAVRDSFVVTGTSDGRFVQAINLETGREIWKHPTAQAVWSSAIINNDKVYTGGFDGQLLCLDLMTGNRISQFSTNGIIFSSPVISDNLLYVGSDDGHLYALRGRKNRQPDTVLNRYVYFNDQAPVYFRASSETRIKNYLAINGFKVIAADTLAFFFSQTTQARHRVLVADGSYFPEAVWKHNENSALRNFLDAGGRLVLIGNNPLFYEVDEKTKEINLNIPRTDSVLGIHYGINDTRAFGGLFPGFPTSKGKEFGLPDAWVSNFGLDPKQVDIILGKNENGQASAFVKKYKNGGCLVQLWINESLPVSLDAIIKVSENEID